MSSVCAGECGAKCCRYITLLIKSPAKNKVNRDEARWCLMHENISLVREDGDWYVQVDTRCRNLTSDGLCGIYQDRPDVCRQYEAECCDHHGEPDDKDLFITTADQWDQYLAARKEKKREKKAGKRSKKDKQDRGGVKGKTCRVA